MRLSGFANAELGDFAVGTGNGRGYTRTFCPWIIVPSGRCYFITMTPQIFLLLVILAAAVAAFISERFRPDTIAMTVMLCLGLTQLVTVQQAFSGLSSSSVILIIAVFILTGGLFRTGVSALIGRWLIRVAGENEFRMAAVVTVAAAGLSLFMNNIASAAVIMPAVMDASRHTRISPSKLLLPMAFATQLGGMATLLTTASIVASGVLQNAGLRGFGLFDFASVGGLAAVAGCAFLILAGPRLLPAKHPMQAASRQQQLRQSLAGVYGLPERLHAAQLGRASPLVGLPLGQAGIGDRLGMTVLAIERNGSTVLAPAASEVLRAQDVLLVEGRAERAAQMSAWDVRVAPAGEAASGLVADEAQFMEVLVAPRSSLVGQTLKQAQFRAKFGLNVVALWSGNRSIRTDVGDIVLRGGEALLLHGAPAAVALVQHDPDWIVLRIDSGEGIRPRKMLLALGILAASLAVSAAGPWPVSLVLFIGALVMILSGCLTIDEAYQAIEWRSVFLVGGMLPVGLALTSTGAAKLLGEGIFQLLGGLGPMPVVAGLFAVTSALNQLIPGGSAVPAVLTPIAIAAAQALKSDPRAFALVIAIATGTSVLTPFAHPVNVLVMGPGGYHFGDYVRLGLPLVAITLAVVMVALPLMWRL